MAILPSSVIPSSCLISLNGLRAKAYMPYLAKAIVVPCQLWGAEEEYPTINDTVIFILT
jgi:hypothetical protein